MTANIIAITHTTTFYISNLSLFKQQSLHWANQFPVCTYLNNNEYQSDPYHRYEALIAVGKEKEIIAMPKQDSFVALKKFYEEKKDWLFGFLSYDLKNEIENLESQHPDRIDLPNMHFFQPTYVLEIFSDRVVIHSKGLSGSLIFNTICNIDTEFSLENQKKDVLLQSRLSKEQYLNKIAAIQTHIAKGDIYEMNFCQEFFVENFKANPLPLFQQFNQLSPAPFTAFYKWQNKYLLCASPERFLQKRGQQLITQPIKGTIQRGKNQTEDEYFYHQLANSLKDRSENIMIVDLVRNDLGKSCVTGSIEVKELCKIYGFAQVFQMISTVEGRLRKDIHFVDAIKNAFPMGSMTGAPKLRSMQLIERYELSKRGLYSGAVGYIRPDGDFDFNVVIRSMIYNEKNKYLSFQTGGAIVADSVAESEYEECLLKGKAMRKCLI